MILSKPNARLVELAARLGRTRRDVYRVRLEESAEQLLTRRSGFIDDPLYDGPDAAMAVAALTAVGELPDPERPEDRRLPRDLPPFLRELYREPLLSAGRERALFLTFNYQKKLFATARRLDPQLARRRELVRLEKLWADATGTKNQILRANLRLVVSVARRHVRPGVSLNELVSEGSVVLMRAVEGFDVHTGNRFSTYATLALMKGFARSVPAMRSTRGRGTSNADALDACPDRRFGGDARLLADRDQIRHLLDRLEPGERRALCDHFGIFDPDGRSTDVGVNARASRISRDIALGKLRSLVSN